MKFARALFGTAILTSPWAVGMVCANYNHPIIGWVFGAMGAAIVWGIAFSGPEVRYEHPQIEPDDADPSDRGV